MGNIGEYAKVLSAYSEGAWARARTLCCEKMLRSLPDTSITYSKRIEMKFVAAAFFLLCAIRFQMELKLCMNCARCVWCSKRARAMGEFSSSGFNSTSSHILLFLKVSEYGFGFSSLGIHFVCFNSTRGISSSDDAEISRYGCYMKCLPQCNARECYTMNNSKKKRMYECISDAQNLKQLWKVDLKCS